MNVFSQFFGPSVNQIEPLEAKTRLGRKPAPVLLDVRQPEEYRQAHISGAKLIPLGELSRRMKELPAKREIICVCRSGNRSTTAARKLIAAGYEVSNLKGGMLNWSRQGLPVQKGSTGK
ncbi:MAG: rhodanese-like domain-containing protein [Omnitrophica WOR_2 bacterium]